MDCTEAYKEHIEYTFNAFCRVVIHYDAINAWRSSFTAAVFASVGNRRLDKCIERRIAVNVDDLKT
jgi:hypothetical protein